MIRDYTDPNVCYAVGDAVAVHIGTATANYQPASGVEDKITMLITAGTSDNFHVYDGTNTTSVLEAACATAVGQENNYMNMYNLGLMITNSMYMRKTGTTDRFYIGGVQTNA